MLLASDVISHLALPGLGLALLFHWNSLAGAGVSLFIGTYIVWRLQKRTGLKTDAAIGVVETGEKSLATRIRASRASFGCKPACSRRRTAGKTIYFS
jgi:ABC-type Mn2+/Zn2+ transport system permease subunit